jgi:TM2 domain-containing membrane protein YozV
MTSVIEISFTFIFVFIIAINLQAQLSSDEQFNYAKKLYDEEKYFDAITEFKRLLFFDNTNKYSYEANKLIGLSYKQGAKFSDAVYHFTVAEKNFRTSEELFETRIEIIKVNILRRSTGRAFALLDSLKDDKRFTHKIDEINYWRGWAFIFLDDWASASVSFASISPNHDLKSFADSINNQFYDVKLAKVLSIFVPGAGQFYTGEFVSGFISLGWNVLWGYLTVSAFVDDRIFDGFMIGTLLWWRFYTGNLQNAEKFALEKNLNITNNALRYLKNDYTGFKP